MREHRHQLLGDDARLPHGGASKTFLRHSRARGGVLKALIRRSRLEVAAAVCARLE